jgi:hypothetical protein
MTKRDFKESQDFHKKNKNKMKIKRKMVINLRFKISNALFNKKYNKHNLQIKSHRNLNR